jgi:hypothetical protein
MKMGGMQPLALVLLLALQMVPKTSASVQPELLRVPDLRFFPREQLHRLLHEATWTGERTAERHFEVVDESGRFIRHQSRVLYSPNVLHMDQSLRGAAVVNITCNDPALLVVEYATPMDARLAGTALFGRERLVLVGGAGYVCVGERSSSTAGFMRRVLSFNVAGSLLLVATEMPALTEVFEVAKIDHTVSHIGLGHWSTDELVSGRAVVPVGGPQRAALGSTRLGKVGGIWSWFWGGVKSFVDDVVDVVVKAIKVVDVIVTGKLIVDPLNHNITLMSFNYDSNTHSASDVLNFNDFTTCSNCYGYFDVGVIVGVHIENYVVPNITLIAYGDLEMALRAESSMQSELSFSTIIPFVPPPFPPVLLISGLSVQPKMNIDFGATMNVSASATVVAEAYFHGRVEYGVTAFHNGTGTEYQLIKSATIDRCGNISAQNYNIMATAEVDATVTLTLVFDYIGGPAIAFRPYAELIVGKSDQSASCNGGYTVAANWGLQVTLGAIIDIVDTIAFTLAAVPVYSIKRPLIVPYCTSDDGSQRLGLPSMTSPDLKGMTWFGSVAAVESDSCFMPSQVPIMGSMSIQLIDVMMQTYEIALSYDSASKIQSCFYQMGGYSMSYGALAADPMVYNCSGWSYGVYIAKNYFSDFSLNVSDDFQTIHVNGDESCFTGNLSLVPPSNL